jgi:oligoendopeptidase F
MFAEFEHLTHARVESGQPLTLESLSDIYGGVAEVYLPGVNIDDLVRIGWSRVPHFYRGFYVFQYATGLSAGVALARAIRDEGTSAAERYLKMLSSGGSDYPLALLQVAGVDLSTPEPVRSALQVFAETVTEMEKLVNDGVFA